jgi:perosamine synthetase
VQVTGLDSVGTENRNHNAHPPHDVSRTAAAAPTGATDRAVTLASPAQADASIAPIKPFLLDLTDEEIEDFGRGAADVLRSGMLLLGEQTRAFEAEFAAYVGTRFAIALSSGTAALEILLRIQGVEGRTVLVPTNTNFATAAAVLRAGGRVRYLDMDPVTFAPTLAIVEDALARLAGEDVAGLFWVHIGGVISPELPGVVDFCRRHGLFVFEDAAHAHGSALGGVKAGALADNAAFSFFPTKVMTTGEGGMITTNVAEVDLLARSFRNQGKRGGAFGGLHHDLGNSFRITEVGAVLGRIQLAKLPAMLARRRRACDLITAALDRAGLAYVSTAHMDTASNYKLIVPLPPSRTAGEVQKALAADGVILGGAVYEIPCHRQPVFAGIDVEAELPNADLWCPRHICPPLTSGMTDEQAERVGAALVKHLA